MATFTRQLPQWEYLVIRTDIEGTELNYQYVDNPDYVPNLEHNYGGPEYFWKASYGLTLNEFGAKGWELVSIVPVQNPYDDQREIFNALFKRPLL